MEFFQKSENETIVPIVEMNEIEVARLNGMEEIIERGKKTFIEVGTALSVIRDMRLYRDKYDTFEQYCNERWGFSRIQAHRLIESSEIAIELLPIGNIPNEGTAREFVNVPAEDRPAVAEAAKSIATEHGRDSINSRDVKEAKERFTYTKTEETRSTPSKPDLTSDQTRRLNLVREGFSQIANIKTDSALIEIAEREGLFCRVDRNSIWGNPYILGEDGDRSTVIENYLDYLGKKPSLQKKAELLRGKLLGCWCYPEPCHALHLIEEFRL